MANKLMLGLWRYMLTVPPSKWEKQLAEGQKKFEEWTAFMSPEHRAVHHFVVRELPYYGKPLPLELVADRMGLSKERVKSILDDLEEHMTFVFRNPEGDVTWAYPVTVEKTPHHLTFSTGERLYAA